MPSWISPNVIALIIFIGLVAAVAFFGGQWGADSWYRALSKPSWTPPSWLFPPVWSLLYMMIAIAGWQIWKTPDESRNLLLGIWAAQLLFNGAWSYIFFGHHEIALAFADIIIMWVLIVAFIILAWPVNTIAAALFVPYLVWVSYAAALNGSIWLQNG